MPRRRDVTKRTRFVPAPPLIVVVALLVIGAARWSPARASGTFVVGSFTKSTSGTGICYVALAVRRMMVVGDAGSSDAGSRTDYFERKSRSVSGSPSAWRRSQSSAICDARSFTQSRVPQSW